MTNDRKHGFLSSLFGKKKRTEEEVMAELESKQKLEARIREILAERIEAPAPVAMDESLTATKPNQEELETPVELLPISASVIGRRKSVLPSVLVLSSVEQVRSYATPER